MNENLVVCAVDTGYSNVKIAAGTAGSCEPEVMIFPAYASKDCNDDLLLVKTESENEVLVRYRDNDWRVFGEKTAGRELHDDYHNTDAYMALYLGALEKLSTKIGCSIDLLVTGLPVRLAYNETVCNALKNRLEDSFIVNGKTITVKHVRVMAQGVGVINDIINREGLISQEELKNFNILVVDPGFFSVDYVTFSEGKRIDEFSGSSLMATSAIIDRIIRILQDENPAACIAALPEIIEEALRNRAKNFFSGCGYIEIGPLLQRVIPQVSESVIRELKRITRSLSIQIIMTAGGGTDFYEQAIRAAFPSAKLITSPYPVASNCLGFWNLGADIALYGD